MFWNGGRRPPDDGQPVATPRQPSRRSFRGWVSTGVMALVLLSLLVPVSSVAAARPSAQTQRAEWKAISAIKVYQEGNRAISYRGAWVTVHHPGYLGDKARAAKAGKARATLRFKGAAVSWIGPIGPTRGKAKIYIDGKLVKTVNTWASHFRPARVLFEKSWNAVGTHRISIVSLGTRGHPTVAVDAFVVRLGTDLMGAKTRPTPKPKATPKATASPAPTPKAAAEPAPTPAPHGRPDPRAARPPRPPRPRPPRPPRPRPPRPPRPRPPRPPRRRPPRPPRRRPPRRLRPRPPRRLRPRPPRRLRPRPPRRLRPRPPRRLRPRPPRRLRPRPPRRLRHAVTSKRASTPRRPGAL